MINNTLFLTVVDRGKANDVLHKFRGLGAEGGTIFLGEGTVQSKVLEKLGLNKTHKEILMIAVPDQLEDKLHDMLYNTLMFDKRNTGIAFSVPMKRWNFEKTIKETDKAKEFYDYPYHCIMVIVDKGRSKECVKSARTAGARGGTVIFGRGAGVPEDYYFPLSIEPQKDIVMILAADETVINIKNRIITDLELEKPGNGMLFILPINKAIGLRTDLSKGGI